MLRAMPSADEIAIQIQRRLAEQQIAVGPDDDLLTSGVIDSIGMMQLIASLEDELGVTVPPADLVPENFCSARVMGDYLRRLIDRS